MEYLGENGFPAPVLNNVRLEMGEVQPLFNRLMEHIKLWLSLNIIHADLSPFNVLYWEGEIKVIDFPQAVDPRFNPKAETFLERDIENVCRYFSRFGLKTDSAFLAADLWWQFLNSQL